MKKIFSWVKNNKLSVFLIVVVLYLFFSARVSRYTGVSEMMVDNFSGGADLGAPVASMMNAKISGTRGFYGNNASPRLDVTDRMVVTNSSLSLMVKDVKTMIVDIKGYVKSLGGYMVSSSQNAPEGAASGNITIRIPSEQLDAALDYLRGKSVKVVNEDISGTDITDSYMDIQERLRTLENTKNKYQSILDKAVEINDIMNITNMILNVQDQIDSLKGNIRYLEESSKSTLITIYLSTDEFSLPYTPEASWRPEVIFKNAVRSLVSQLRLIGTGTIWLLVNSVLWIPALFLGWLIFKKLFKSTNK